MAFNQTQASYCHAAGLKRPPCSFNTASSEGTKAGRSIGIVNTMPALSQLECPPPYGCLLLQALSQPRYPMDECI